MKNENTTATLPAEQVEEASETSQKPKKKKVTRRVLLGGGLGILAVAGVGAGWAYNRYLAEHTQIDDTVAYENHNKQRIIIHHLTVPQVPANSPTLRSPLTA